MSEHSLKIAFAGTPDLAATALTKILEQPAFELTLVITQPDRRAGRGRQPTASPVKALAEQHRIALEQPTTAGELDAEGQLSNFDVMVVAAYGMLIPEAVLQRPRLGCLNIHTSLLPRWRGAAPIQRAIEAGDAQTGVSIMQMEKGLDTGPVLLQKHCAIEADDTAGSLHDKLAKLGGEAIVEVLHSLTAGSYDAVPQNPAGACYAHKIVKREAALDWQLAAAGLERKIRAFNPKPVCYTSLHGQEMRVWQAKATDRCHSQAPGTVIDSHNEGIEVACGEGSLLLQRIQLPGKKPISAAEFLRGHPQFLETKSPG